MKSTFKIEFHILYYVVGFFCFLMGYFKDFIWISLLIMIHECGHVTGAIFYNWKIERVLILPFGGMTRFKEHINVPIHQEWWIVLLGPLYQIGFFFLLKTLGYTNFTFTYYHYLLLCFNLLPILPLDGSKILGLGLDSICSYHQARIIQLKISVCCLIGLFGYVIYMKNIIFLIILLFLAKENWKTYKQIPYQMERFLLERYLYSTPRKRYKRIQGANLNQMKRDCTHLFWINGTFQKEHEILKSYFEFL